MRIKIKQNHNLYIYTSQIIFFIVLSKTRGASSRLSGGFLLELTAFSCVRISSSSVREFVNVIIRLDRYTTWLVTTPGDCRTSRQSNESRWRILGRSWFSVSWDSLNPSSEQSFIRCLQRNYWNRNDRRNRLTYTFYQLTTTLYWKKFLIFHVTPCEMTWHKISGIPRRVNCWLQ